MEPTPNNIPVSNQETLSQNINKMYELKTAAMQLILESHTISRETQLEVTDILKEPHLEMRELLRQLADYLNGKNPKIFKVDELIKQGHKIGMSKSIDELGLSNEDIALLEWFQQVRV